MFRIFAKKNKKDDEIRTSVLSRLDGREVKYVTERDGKTYGEKVIGHTGVINLADGFMAISCSNEIVFRCDALKVDANEFLSLDGVNFIGYDETCGKNRHVIAYYLYHRK